MKNKIIPIGALRAILLSYETKGGDIDNLMKRLEGYSNIRLNSELVYGLNIYILNTDGKWVVFKVYHNWEGNRY